MLPETEVGTRNNPAPNVRDETILDSSTASAGLWNAR
jgi:hypothetical protein